MPPPPVDGEGARPGARTGSTRATPPLLLLLAAVLLLARVGAGIYEHYRPPGAKESLDWHPIQGAIEDARRAGKPVLYYFTADWCTPCRRMSREVFADAKAAQSLRSMFVPVRVLDRSKEEGRNSFDVAALEARYNVEAFPTFVIVPPEAGSPTVIEGYPGKEALLRQLGQAAMSMHATRSIRLPVRDPLRDWPDSATADSSRGARR